MYEIIKSVKGPSSVNSSHCYQHSSSGPRDLSPVACVSSVSGEREDDACEIFPPRLSNGRSKFSNGDRVVVYNVNGKVINGTVRWVGSMTGAGRVIVPVVIGIETVSVQYKYSLYNARYTN